MLLMQLKGVTTRLFEIRDLDEVVRINRQTLPENYSHSFFLSLHHSFPEAFLVAEADGKIVGYVMCRIEEFPGGNGFKKVGHVVSIAVSPGYRRKGIATSLMQRAMEAMREVYGARECYLEVRTTNKPAISLYSKLGLRVVNRIKGYYLDGEDAFIMSKSLT